MHPRIKLTVLLVSLGFLLVILPGAGEYSFTANRDELVSSVFDEGSFFSVDRVAAFVVSEDSTVQLIDLRSTGEYNSFNIPGSINIPLNMFFSLKPETWLYNRDMQYIFYSNDDEDAAYALVLARGLGYGNSFAMKGGLNEWFEKVMNSTFPSGPISARENALYESRIRARQFFTTINSLPDSLRIKYAESRRQAERNLDGGCD